MRSDKRVVFAITGGGTGGHFYPAFSVARELVNQGYKVIYIGHPNKIEAKVNRDSDIKFYGINSDYFYDLKISKLLNPFPLIKVVYQAIRVLKKEKVDVLIAFGGYVSVPAFLAAQILRIKTAVHEQNVKPGRANRLFLKFNPLFLTTFKSTSRYIDKKIIFKHVGCPINKDIGLISSSEARGKLTIDSEKLVILIVGGSGGAPAINTFAINLHRYFILDPRIIIFHITGEKYFNAVLKEFGEKYVNMTDNYKIISFANPISLYYATADIIISRAGSAAINEILATRKISILIPSPNVAEDHQLENAKILESIGQSILLEEKNLDARTTSELIYEIFRGNRIFENYQNNSSDELSNPHLAAQLIVSTLRHSFMGESFD